MDDISLNESHKLIKAKLNLALKREMSLAKDLRALDISSKSEISGLRQDL